MEARAVRPWVGVLIVLLAPLPAAAGAPIPDDLLTKAYARGRVRVLVTLASGWQPEGKLGPAATASQRAGLTRKGDAVAGALHAAGARVLHRFDRLPHLVAEVSPAALADLASSADVAAVHEDVAYPVTLSASSPLVQANDAWGWQRTGAGKTVAVLDTGVRASHIFFGGRVVGQACFSTTSSGISSSNCPSGTDTQIGSNAGAACTYASDCFHGTHVAGIVAGSGSSSAGVGRGAGIYAIQVFSRFDNPADCSPLAAPCTFSYVSDQIEALNHVFAQRFTYNFAAVNMSLGGGQFTGFCDTQPHKPAIDQLRSVGIATVIASGNDGYRNAISSPACISSAVSVGSTTKTDVASSFSNAASFMSLWAPGSSINSSSSETNSAFRTVSGTSMAAPHVAGAWSVLKQHRPAATVSEILSALDSTGLSVRDTRSGGSVTRRRISVMDALRMLCPPAPIGRGTMVPGSLETSDCRAWQRDAYADSYAFTAWAGEPVAFALDSAFDGYLQLLDAGGNVVAQDDNGGGGTSARIPAGGGFLSIPANGTYTVQALAVNANSVGAYLLTFAIPPTPSPTPAATATPTPSPTPTPTPSPMPPATPVVWINAGGVSISGNDVTKTAADGWGNAGASSVQSISSGYGFVAFTATETTRGRLAGLGSADSNFSYTDVDYGLLLAGSGSLLIYENGTPRGTFGNYASGDVMSVGVEGGAVRYRRNGILIYTSTVPPSYPLFVDCALNSNASTLTDVLIGGNVSGNLPPVAQAGGPYRWPAGQPVHLDGTRSSDPGGSISSYQWSFGDGTSGTGPMPTHTYAAAGTFTATLTVTDAAGATAVASAAVEIEPAGLARPVVWTNAVGVTVSGSALTKTAASGWGNAGASSTQALVADGYAAFTANETTRGRVFGLGNGDSNQDYADLEYGILLTGGGLVGVYESGTFRGYFGGYAAGDVLRVGVESGAVRYRKNGALLYASGTAPAYPLLVDSALNTTGAAILSAVVLAPNTPPTADPGGPYTWVAGQAIRFDGTHSSDRQGPITSFAWSFGDGATASGPTPTHAYASPGSYALSLTVTDADGVSSTAGTSVTVQDPGLESAVVWTNTVGVGVSGSSLTKTAISGWGNSGAVSVKTIAAGDGYVSFTAAETDKGRLVGLGHGDASQSYTDVEFGILLQGSATVAIYEAGVYRGAFGSYTGGDVFRVGIESGSVRYRKNGVVFYTSGVLPTYPLRVDTALNATGSTVSSARLHAPTALPVARPGGPYRWSQTHEIELNGSASSDADGTIVSYWWDCGDSSGEGGPTVRHSYTQPGSYTVTLTVTDNDGNMASATTTVTIEDATPSRVEWTNDAGVRIDGGSLTKTGPDGWGNAGASSAQTITGGGDGYVSFRINEHDHNKGRIIGLDAVDSSRGYADVDYGIFLGSNGMVSVYEAGVFRGTFGTYGHDDVFRVSVESGVVRYRKNGAPPFFSSPTAPTYPLRADAALNQTNAFVADAYLLAEP